MKPSVPANTHIYIFSFKKPSFIARYQHTELGSRESEQHMVLASRVTEAWSCQRSAGVDFIHLFL